MCKIKACSRDNINTFEIKHGFKKSYAQLHNHIIICNEQYTYGKKNYISKWNKKRNNYTIMYNVRMNTNVKMERRRLHL